MKKEEYHQLLKDGRWQRRRLEIMQRDDFKCRDCGTTDDLNVHHIRYIAGHKPWEYEDIDLITLCGKCHKKRHEKIEDFQESMMCKSCAFQLGCEARDEDIACDNFNIKTCLSCLHFQISGDDSFDGFCTYTGKDIDSGGPCAEDCNAEYYSPVALNQEDWKEYIKRRGWD